MPKFGSLLATTAVISMAALSPFAGTLRADEKDLERLDEAAAVLTEIMDTPDKGIPQEVLEHAKCVAVVPNMLKGGFVLGGSHGKGVATCRNGNGWSAPAFFSIKGGSFGLSFGHDGRRLVASLETELKEFQQPGALR